MIGLVRLALRRPYTMAIAALLIMLMGALSVTRMVVDIFPDHRHPRRATSPGATTASPPRTWNAASCWSPSAPIRTTVNGIERIESQSIPGTGILKVYFQPGTDIGGAIAQISAQNNSILRIAPPGMHAAEHDPVQRVERARGAGHADQQDAARAADLRLRLNFMRMRLFTIPGLSIPAPYRRQAAPDHRRRRPGAAAPRALADGRGERVAGRPT